jgi:putative transposase
MKDELLNGEIFDTMQEARVLIEIWRVYYNTIRPHSSLEYSPHATESWVVSISLQMLTFSPKTDPFIMLVFLYNKLT